MISPIIVTTLSDQSMKYIMPSETNTLSGIAQMMKNVIRMRRRKKNSMNSAKIAPHIPVVAS